MKPHKKQKPLIKVFKEILDLESAERDVYLVTVADEKFLNMIELVSLLREKSRRLKLSTNEDESPESGCAQ